MDLVEEQAAEESPLLATGAPGMDRLAGCLVRQTEQIPLVRCTKRGHFLGPKDVSMRLSWFNGCCQGKVEDETLLCMRDMQWCIG